MTSIGIIGAGEIGRAIATALARKGIKATIANSRGPESLNDIAAAIGPGIVAGSRQQAAASDIVFVAVNWSKLPAALKDLPDFGGRIVVDANNPIEAPLFKPVDPIEAPLFKPVDPIEAPLFKPVDLGSRSSSELFAALVPGAHVVKAFNHLRPPLVAGDPASDGGRRVLFYSGDDGSAKAEVGSLIDSLGFFGIDLGSLAIGSRLTQFPGGPLPALNLVNID